MANYEEKAVEFRAQAEKKIASKGFLEVLFGGGSNRIEKALEYYQKAGNLFKLAKNWLQAGAAFVDAAELYSRINEPHNAATAYVDAAQCLRKNDYPNAVEYLLKAIEIYTDLGRFTTVAKYHQLIAEILEDNMDLERATVHYEHAADFYQCENSFTNANKCLSKVGDHAAIKEQYYKAIEIFQHIARFNLSTSLLKYGVKEYFFKAIICHLCISDSSEVENVLKTYMEMNPAFEDSREYKFLLHILKCLEKGDETSFTKNVEKYDSVSKLTPWHVTMLLRVKWKITETPDLR